MVQTSSEPPKYDRSPKVGDFDRTFGLAHQKTVHRTRTGITGLRAVVVMNEDVCARSHAWIEELKPLKGLVIKVEIQQHEREPVALEPGGRLREPPLADCGIRVALHRAPECIDTGIPKSAVSPIADFAVLKGETLERVEEKKRSLGCALNQKGTRVASIDTNLSEIPLDVAALLCPDCQSHARESHRVARCPDHRTEVLAVGWKLHFCPGPMAQERTSAPARQPEQPCPVEHLSQLFFHSRLHEERLGWLARCNSGAVAMLEL